MTDVVVFHSYHGGAAKTDILLNVAYKLAEMQAFVVIVDGCLSNPSFQLMKSVYPGPLKNNGLSGFIEENFRHTTRDVTQFGDYLKTGDKTMFVIPSGVSNQHSLNVQLLETENVMLSLVNQIIDDLEPDFILMNGEVGLNNLSRAQLSVISDTSIFVTALDSLSILGTKESLKWAQEWAEQADMVSLPILALVSNCNLSINHEEWDKFMVKPLQQVSMLLDPLLKKRFSKVKNQFPGVDIFDLRVMIDIVNTERSITRLTEIILNGYGADVPITDEETLDTISLSLDAIDKNLNRENKSYKKFKIHETSKL